MNSNVCLKNCFKEMGKETVKFEIILHAFIDDNCHVLIQGVDTWQPSRVFEWILIFRNPTKGPQGIW